MGVLIPSSAARLKVWVERPHQTPFIAITEPFAPLALGWLDRDTEGGLATQLSKELGYRVTGIEVTVRTVTFPDVLTYNIRCTFDDVPQPYDR